MSTAYLSLGSNLGDRAANLDAAIAKLGEIGSVAERSSNYETEPVEVTDQPWFLNCVVEFETELEPIQLITAVLKIERSMGRTRTRDKGPRSIDIDILLYGDRVLDIAGLTIPHPAMHVRRFVLEPLAEIAPEVRHPVFKQPVRELLAAQPAQPQVRRVGQ